MRPNLFSKSSLQIPFPQGFDLQGLFGSELSSEAILVVVSAS